MAKQTEQSKIAPKTGNSDWRKMVSEAPDLVEIPEKLNLGGKSGKVRHVVEFVEAEPRSITFKDRFNDNQETTALAINVRVIESNGDADTQETPGATRGLIFSDTDSGIGKGVAGLAKRHGSLKGVRAEITTRFYTHKTYGPNTKGFNVSDMGRATPADDLP